jgi:flagellar biosynthetic protein FliP
MSVNHPTALAGPREPISRKAPKAHQRSAGRSLLSMPTGQQERLPQEYHRASWRGSPGSWVRKFLQSDFCSFWIVMIAVWGLCASGLHGAPPNTPSPPGLLPQLVGDPQSWTSREGLASALQIVLLLTVLSLAPAIVLMTTSFVRIVVVLGLVRQALGTQQLPPGQVLTSLALFMTLLIMTPVWSEVYQKAIVPYTRGDGTMTLEEMWREAVAPVRKFMSRQIDAAGNSDDVWLFYDYLAPEGPEPTSYDDVPLQVLLPAYMLSELKTAFLIGFQIYLPFLILDMIVASVTISMGMLMLPPIMISLPFKLLLFVMVDGWRLVVGMLLQSFV